MKKSYFHLFANGGETGCFIISGEDFKAAFNRVGVCAFHSNVSVLAFSIEETHPHFLIFGEREDCIEYMKSYELSTLRYIVATRGTKGDVDFKMSLYEVDSEEYLMNVAAYVIVQPTKDGKRVLPYDYLWGTASLYFRNNPRLLPWLYDADGNRLPEIEMSVVPVQTRWKILNTRKEVPGNWKVCNGLLLPTNYVDIARYEAIFKTHNCFRSFMSCGKRQDDSIFAKMSNAQPPVMDDLEARRICADASNSLFGHSSISKLTVQERISLAQFLRHDTGISVRQLARLIHIPMPELRKFIR